MLRRMLILLLFVTSGAVSSPLVRAQELTTDAERSWRELRGSKDVKRKLLAERWNNVTRQQEWSDTTGKFKTSAKYVEHDPQLAWVKLRVIQGTGSQRVVKDVQIPLEKLSKSCQSRVRQIATLSEKIAAAIEEEKKAAEEDKAGAAGDRGEMMEEGRGAGEELDGGMAETDAAGPAAESRGEVLSEYGRTETASEPPVTNNGPPLPAALPPLPAGVATTESAAAEPAVTVDGGAEAVAASGLDPSNPNFPDNDPWRTDYEAFRTVFNRDEDGIISTAARWWGVLELQSAIPGEYIDQEPGDASPKPFVASQRAAAIGDFMWEATVVTEPSPDANWADVFGLSPLPEPLKLELKLSAQVGAEAWQSLRPGDRVKFIGRFTGYQGAYTWVAEIRPVDAGDRASSE